MNGDITFNVLSLLPIKTLLELRCVSKGWNSLISDRSFIQAQLQKTGSMISGFIFQENFHWCNEDIKTFSYISVGSCAQVQKMTFNFLPEDVVILASCNGLICCRSCFPSQDPAIYVCNPLNKEWVRLELAATDIYNSICLAFDPSRDPIDVSTNFKLVIVHQFENEQEELYYAFKIYYSNKGVWRESNEFCQCRSKLSKNKGIYAGGILHWLTDDDQVLTFDIENELSLVISVPVPVMEFKCCVPESCIGESEGRLHYVMVSEEGIHVWYLEDYLESKWTLKHTKSLKLIEEEHPQLFYNLLGRVLQQRIVDENLWMDLLAFKDGILLMRVASKIYMYHTEASKFVEICTLTVLGPNSIYGPTVLPYSTSLVPVKQISHSLKVADDFLRASLFHELGSFDE